MEQQAFTPIYTGARRSKLIFTIKMLSWQVRHKISDIGMDDLFKHMQEDIVPQGNDNNGNIIVNNVPLNRVEAQKVIHEVVFDYETFDTCPCDNFLYYGEVKGSLKECP